MLTLVVRAGRDPVPLVETLTPLVEGVVRGLIGRSVIVAAADCPSEIAAVAEEAGAEMLVAADWERGLARAAAEAKTSRLVLADAGIICDHAFLAALDRFLRTAGADAVAATKPASATHRIAARLMGVVAADQIVILPKAAVAGGIWGHRFKHVALLDSTSRRLAGP